MSSERKLNQKQAGRAPLPAEALDLIAARFRALGEPMRLRLLSALMERPRSVTQLVEETGAGQANVSKHLAVLRQANMVHFRKQGAVTIYFIADPLIERLCELMCSGLKKALAEKAALLGEQS